MQTVSVTFEAPLCSLPVLDEAPVTVCTRLFHSTLGFAVLLMVPLGVNKQPSKRSVSAEMPEARADLGTLPRDCSGVAMSASTSLPTRRRASVERVTAERLQLRVVSVFRAASTSGDMHNSLQAKL